METVDLAASVRAVWDITPDTSIYVDEVHRLSELGAVVTQARKGTSPEGFDAEWRTINLFTVRGDLLSRCEIFDEASIDSALARLKELHPTPPLQNAASHADHRFFAYFGAGNWAALANEILAENSCVDNRCRVVNAGSWDGADVIIENLQALEEAGKNVTLTVIATRGERLALTRMCSASSDLRYGEFNSELLIISEIDTDDRIAAHIVFDLDDIDAAFEELEARYLAAEAATHSQVWSVISKIYAGFNRHEFPPTTSDSVYIDHRPLVKIEAADFNASVRLAWELTPDIKTRIEAVHRLSELGAVVTQVLCGTSQEGLDAEWRLVAIFAVEGDLMSRIETFDEADLDAALVRFEELQPPPPARKHSKPNPRAVPGVLRGPRLGRHR
jgi:hypothetical protein